MKHVLGFSLVHIYSIYLYIVRILDRISFQSAEAGSVPQEAQDFDQMEEPESRLQRRVRLRNETDGVVHAEPLHHRLRQGLRQEQRLPGRLNPRRNGIEG